MLLNPKQKQKQQNTKTSQSNKIKTKIIKQQQQNVSIQTKKVSASNQTYHVMILIALVSVSNFVSVASFCTHINRYRITIPNHDITKVKYTMDMMELDTMLQSASPSLVIPAATSLVFGIFGLLLLTMNTHTSTIPSSSLDTDSVNGTQLLSTQDYDATMNDIDLDLVSSIVDESDSLSYVMPHEEDSPDDGTILASIMQADQLWIDHEEQVILDEDRSNNEGMVHDDFTIKHKMEHELSTTSTNDNTTALKSQEESIKSREFQKIDSLTHIDPSCENSPDSEMTHYDSIDISPTSSTSRSSSINTNIEENAQAIRKQREEDMEMVKRYVLQKKQFTEELYQQRALEDRLSHNQITKMDTTVPSSSTVQNTKQEMKTNKSNTIKQLQRPQKIISQKMKSKIISFFKQKSILIFGTVFLSILFANAIRKLILF